MMLQHEEFHFGGSGSRSSKWDTWREGDDFAVGTDFHPTRVISHRPCVAHLRNNNAPIRSYVAVVPSRGVINKGAKWSLTPYPDGPATASPNWRLVVLRHALVLRRRLPTHHCGRLAALHTEDLLVSASRIGRPKVPLAQALWRIDWYRPGSSLKVLPGSGRATQWAVKQVRGAVGGIVLGQQISRLCTGR